MAWLAFTTLIILGKGTFFYTKWSVPNMPAAGTVAWSRSETFSQTLFVTVFTDLASCIIDPVSPFVYGGYWLFVDVIVVVSKISQVNSNERGREDEEERNEY